MPCSAGEVLSRLPLAEPRIIFLNSICLGPCSFVSDFKKTTRRPNAHQSTPVMQWKSSKPLLTKNS